MFSAETFGVRSDGMGEKDGTDLAKGIVVAFVSVDMVVDGVPLTGEEGPTCWKRRKISTRLGIEADGGERGEGAHRHNVG